MPTINEVIERVSRARPDALEDSTKAAWLIELEGKIFREVVLRHRITPGCKVSGPTGKCPECGEDAAYFSGGDYNMCGKCGWTDLPDYPKKYPEDGDKELIVKSPYDNIYDLYVLAQADLINREDAYYNNSATVFNTALDEFKRAYHHEHLPISPGEVKL